MKSYSATVSESFFFCAKKLEAVVQNVEEKMERSSDIIINRLEEDPNETLRTKLETVKAQISEKPVVKD